MVTSQLRISSGNMEHDMMSTIAALKDRCRFSAVPGTDEGTGHGSHKTSPVPLELVGRSFGQMIAADTLGDL